MENLSWIPLMLDTIFVLLLFESKQPPGTRNELINPGLLVLLDCDSSWFRAFLLYQSSKK